MSTTPSLFEWLLDSLELEADLFHVGRYCGGWQATTHGLARASFHLVVQGQCWLHVQGAPAAFRLLKGDAVFLLRDIPYRLSGESSREQADCQPKQDMQGLALEAEEGVGLVCGFFQFRSGLSSLIIEALPDHLILRGDNPAVASAGKVFELILDECRRADGPSRLMLEKLSQVLFLHVLRQQADQGTTLKGLVALARSAPFEVLLERMIQQPQHPWTLEDMAALVGMSRSAFFNRFSEVAGQSPGQVLQALRIHKACRLLRDNRSVAEVADAVGYQSVAAFTRLFKRVTGIQPGAYRRQAGSAG